jgi:hypothetical protein
MARSLPSFPDERCHGTGARLAVVDVALGFSLHTGWAVAVAVAGSPTHPEVVVRRQVELVDPALPRQVYHAAAREPTEAGAALVGSVERSARAHASRAVEHLRDDLVADGHRPIAVALCAEPHEVPADLGRILANHTLIHAAEGELYREAVEAAAEWLGLPVLQVAAKRVPAEVRDRLGLSDDRQRALVQEVGAGLGPPWRADHKQATLLAVVALTDATGQPNAIRQMARK